MVFLAEYWHLILGILGAISAPIAYIFGGKQRQKLENKKTEQEVKRDSATAIEAMQSVYDKYIEHDKVRTEKLELRIEALENHNRELQKSFNDMTISYSVVLEESKKWESQYKKLEVEYKKLKKENEDRGVIIQTLKLEHEKLKKDFQSYKKEHQLE
jgi:chromosome segregation ATPase